MTPVQRGAWINFGVLAAVITVAMGLYWALYTMGGGALVLTVAVVVAYAIVAVGWWLHTWSDRQGPE